MIYLDHNATTPIDDRVLEAMMPYLTIFYGNPSSLYRAGRVVRSAIATAREQVAALVGVSATQVVFTSGGTEANNLAIKGVCMPLATGNIAISAIEHPSILDTVAAFGNIGWTIKHIPVDVQGLIKDSVFENGNYSHFDLISIMLANNETGAIQPLASLSEVLKQTAGIIHTDAVQAAGKMAVNFSDLNVDLLTLSSHKIYGPKGAGALIVNKTIELAPLLIGGGQEYGLRAGTENVAAIIGFGKAAELALTGLDRRISHLKQLKTQLQAGLQEIEDITIFSETTERLANTVQFGINNTDGEMLLMQLDKKGFSVSSGSACASGGGQASHVLLAMGVDEKLAKSALRVSLGQHNTVEEMQQFVRALKAIIG